MTNLTDADRKRWHNERGIFWGTPFSGPDPVTMAKAAWPGNLSVHLANEHRVNSDLVPGYEQMAAHTEGRFSHGQEHYHAPQGEKVGPE